MFTQTLPKENTSEIAFDRASIETKLRNLDLPCYVVQIGQKVGITNENPLHLDKGESIKILSVLPPLPPEKLGDRNFCTFHGVKYAYAAGAMAGGIASEALVIALGKAGFLGSFGAAGLLPNRIQTAIDILTTSAPKNSPTISRTKSNY